MTERVAIVGSRGYRDIEAVERYVRELPEGTIVITGGAAGVDTAAEKAARARGLVVDVHRPDYAHDGRHAPLVRNKIIANLCDRMVAFWDGESTGTMHAVRCAGELRKRVEVRR